MSGWQSAFLELDDLWPALTVRMAEARRRPGDETGSLPVAGELGSSD
jgi:hypothetical protein